MHRLAWKEGSCGGYVRLLIKAGGIPVFGEPPLIPNFGAVLLDESKMGELWNEPSDLGKEYTWSLEPCWRVKNDIDCEIGVASEVWRFRTIGGTPPLLESPGNGEFLKVPGELAWQHIDGVGSYLVQTAEDEDFTQKLLNKETMGPSFTLSLEDFEIGNQYWWRVKTCADEKGEVCGTAWSEERMFRTYPLRPVTEPEPADETKFSLPGTLRWQPDDGASYYQYQVRYTSLKYGVDDNGNDILEERPACTSRASETDTLIPDPGGMSPITSQPSFFLAEHCRGEYEWLVVSCADRDCNVKAASPATLWKFTAVKQTSEESSGLVPCGKTIDHTNTPYDETEPCQLKHAGFLLQNLLDFILWKVSLFVLLILAVITGATSYFSLGGPNALVRIKTVFRSFFAGFLILMFAWMFVNIVLMLFGFQFEFFGTWWALSF